MVKSKEFKWHETGLGKIGVSVIAGLIILTVSIILKTTKPDKSNNQSKES